MSCLINTHLSRRKTCKHIYFLNFFSKQSSFFHLMNWIFWEISLLPKFAASFRIHYLFLQICPNTLSIEQDYKLQLLYLIRTIRSYRLGFEPRVQEPKHYWNVPKLVIDFQIFFIIECSVLHQVLQRGPSQLLILDLFLIYTLILMLTC